MIWKFSNQIYGKSEYTTAKKSQSHATILPFREFRPVENHVVLLKTYQNASTSISSLGLAIPEMHNAKVEKNILLCKQNPWLSCIQFQSDSIPVSA